MRQWIFESTVSQLNDLTWQVRNAYAHSLQGSCDAAAHDLGDLLARSGFEANVIEGFYDQPMDWGDGSSHPTTPHSWVECNGLVLDPTREQFDSDELLSQDDPAYLS